MEEVTILRCLYLRYHRRFQAVEPFYNGQARVQCWNGSWQVINELAETVFEIASAREVDAFAAVSADLVGFWKTHTLCAAVELGLFLFCMDGQHDITFFVPRMIIRLPQIVLLCACVELAECKQCVVEIILPKWLGHFGSSLNHQISKDLKRVSHFRLFSYPHQWLHLLWMLPRRSRLQMW